MRVIVEGNVYEWGSKGLLNTEAIQIKRKLGLTPKEWYEAFKAEDIEALTMLVWFARRRAGERDLRYEDVEFDLGAITTEAEEGDLAETPDPTVTATPLASPPATAALADPVPAALAPARNAAATAEPSLPSGK